MSSTNSSTFVLANLKIISRWSSLLVEIQQVDTFSFRLPVALLILKNDARRVVSDQELLELHFVFCCAQTILNVRYSREQTWVQEFPVSEGL